MSETVTRQRRYNREEFARRGTALYEQRIRTQVEPDHAGRIVAIDIDSGAFKVADDTVAAAQALLAEHPESQIWFVRVGRRGVHRFGAKVSSGQV